MRYALPLAIVVGACGGVAFATDLFGWRDGRLQRPPSTASAVPSPTASPPNSPPLSSSDASRGDRTDTEPAAALRFENRGDRIEAWADNFLAGPIEVLLRPLDGPISGAEPALPATAVIDGYDRRIVSRLPGTINARFQLDVMRGDPAAQPRDVDYAYPLADTPLRIEQSWGGGFSHFNAENRYGVDFAADIGATVIAARAGTVMEIEAAHVRGDGGNGGDGIGRANFVRIVHDDGSMALYAHLHTDGVLVRPGQRVRKGEAIALSGDTGFTTGPHLHFAVQVNRGMRLESIPFRMSGPEGALRLSEPN